MLQNIVLTSGARFYSALVAMIILSLSARWLGPEGRGVVVVISTWVNLFATIGYLSLGQVCVYRMANSDDLEWMGPVFAALLMITAAVSAIGSTTAVILAIRPENTGGAFQQLRSPGRDLVRVNVKLLRQLGQRFLILHSSQSHLRLECRTVIPARALRHHPSCSAAMLAAFR